MSAEGTTPQLSGEETPRLDAAGPADLCEASAGRLASMIRSAEVSSREVVEAHIARIRRVNPVLNAVVRQRFERAREEARAADRMANERPASELPPLLGVPCTIKEAFALEGMPNSGGLVSRGSVTALDDATTVARLRRAGAIPLGVTNVSELCMWYESSNCLYGRTENAYRQGRIAGGSSGGEGAAVGAGCSPFGLGSDIGGSIRMPAFFNGVFGHKPTAGLVPSTGQFPISEGDALRMLCSGPLARRAEDLFPLLRILAGPDGRDGACEKRRIGDPADVDLSRLLVLDVAGDGRRVASSLLEAQERAAGRLAETGARVREARFPAMRRAIDLWSARLQRAGGRSFASLLGDERRIRSPATMLRWAFRKSPHTLPALLLALLEAVPRLGSREAEQCLLEERRLGRELVESLGENGVMLYPSFPRPAPPHRVPLLRPFDFRFNAIFNVLEFPVTQVPLGFDERGLPLGVQVAAAPGNDHLTIAVAMELERAFGGWRPPPWIDPG